MIIELKTGSVSAKLDSVGAELISLKNAEGEEYMWQKDPKYWAKSSPFLFPIVGNLRNDTTTIDGQEYHMSKHGFCRTVDFAVIDRNETEVSFVYTYNSETLKVYPYKFSAKLSYKLDTDGLRIRYSFENLDEKPMDYCFGAHPAFRVPLDGQGGFEDYYLEFSEPETADCPVFDFEKNQINVENRVSYLKNEQKLPLKYSYFDQDAIIMDNPKSNRVRLLSSVTGRGVEVEFGDFDFIAFWTPIKAEAPFLCIEPWCGMAVCSDESDEFSQKRGVKHLEPGEEQHYNLMIRPM